MGAVFLSLCLLYTNPAIFCYNNRCSNLQQYLIWRCITLNASQSKPIIVISLITAACLVGDSMLYVVLPTHWQEMGLTSLWQIGAILSINRLIRLPLNPLVSHLYKRISARSGILFAVFLSVLTTAGYGLVSDFVIFLLLRCLWGLAWTFLRLGAYFTILDYSTDANRGRSMGLYNGLYRLGSLVGMLAGGILADLFQVELTALFFACISLACIPAVFIYISRSAKGMVEDAAKSEKDFSLWQHLDTLPILLVGMAVAMIYQGMFTSTLSYIIEVHNSPATSIGGLLIGAASLGGILQAIRWGWEPWLAPWFGSLTDGAGGRYRLLVLSTAAAALLFALLPMEMALPLWLILLLLLQLTATSLTTITDALAADAATRSARVKLMTLYSLLIDLGSAIGPMLAYLLNEYTASYASCWVAALFLLLITLAYAPRAIKAPHKI